MACNLVTTGQIWLQFRVAVYLELVLEVTVTVNLYISDVVAAFRFVQPGHGFKKNLLLFNFYTRYNTPIKINDKEIKNMQNQKRKQNIYLQANPLLDTNSCYLLSTVHCLL